MMTYLAKLTLLISQAILIELLPLTVPQTPLPREPLDTRSRIIVPAFWRSKTTLGALSSASQTWLILALSSLDHRPSRSMIPQIVGGLPMTTVATALPMTSDSPSGVALTVTVLETTELEKLRFGGILSAVIMN